MLTLTFVFVLLSFFFFFNDTATTEIYTLSLHDALPIWVIVEQHGDNEVKTEAIIKIRIGEERIVRHAEGNRSEEHTSELQSRQYLVCRLLLEKKKKK